MKKSFCLFILVFVVCFVFEKPPALAVDPCLTIPLDPLTREQETRPAVATVSTDDEPEVTVQPAIWIDDGTEVTTEPRAVVIKGAVWGQADTVTQETSSTLILRVRFLDGTNEYRDLVRQIAPEWSKYANIRFEFVENDPSDIRIGFDPENGHWSNLGRWTNTSKTMNLALRGETAERRVAVILHEFGHALGLKHEHQNPAASIQWDESAIIQEITQNWGWSEDKIRHNILNQLDEDQTNFTEFDPDSIMIYWIPNRWTIDDFSVNENTALSATDKHFIGTVYGPNLEYRPNFDRNLRAKIESALGKASGATITVADMATLTGLNAINANIRDLTGIEYATNLTALLLRDNNIVDISVVAGLTNLTVLRSGNNSISDISVLAGLTNLTELSLYGNSISKISVLAGLTNLTHLGLGGNNIVDISSVSGLTNLTYLSLGGNNITDISSVSRLTNLTSLLLDNNNVTNISGLSGLTNLTQLWLSHNTLSDISPLAGLTNLTNLWLRGNNISDLSPLVSNTGLGQDDEVDVRGNALNADAYNTHIPALESRGVDVKFDPQPTPTAATVSIFPSPVESPVVGRQFTVSLKIANGAKVAGYQANVVFDTSALRYVKSANGDYLPASAFFVPPSVSGNQVTLAAAGTVESNGDGTLAIVTFEVIAVKVSTLTLSDVVLSDSAGAASRPQVENGQIVEPSHTKGDVNRDGVVNIQDLVLAARRLGQRGQNDADMNGDGVVNIQDLVLVAGAFGSTGAAPALHPEVLMPLTAADVQGWLTEAEQMGLTTPAHRHGIAVLEQLLSALTPKETALLLNYPNPFNPETWIPYHLAEPAEVTLRIYDSNGQVVRTLAFGHQAAGFYEGRHRAAYWDGRNAQGEPVASGVYFYHLSAGDYSATRRMVIVK